VRDLKSSVFQHQETVLKLSTAFQRGFDRSYEITESVGILIDLFRNNCIYAVSPEMFHKSISKYAKEIALEDARKYFLKVTN